MEWIQLEAVQGPNQDEVITKAQNVKATIAQLSTPLRQEKNKCQGEKLDDLSEHLPDMEQVTKFLTMKELDKYFQQVTVAAESATAEELHAAMVLVAGRLMLR